MFEANISFVMSCTQKHPKKVVKSLFTSGILDRMNFDAPPWGVAI